MAIETGVSLLLGDKHARLEVRSQRGLVLFERTRELERVSGGKDHSSEFDIGPAAENGFTARKPDRPVANRFSLEVRGAQDGGERLDVGIALIDRDHTDAPDDEE